MLDPAQLKRFVIEPALAMLAPQIPMTDNAVRIVLGTGMVESDLVYLDQKESQSDKPGPAYGLWGIESPTFHDILERAPGHASVIIGDLTIPGMKYIDQLHGNLFLGAVICRLKYYMTPEVVPTSAWGAASWWKARYNTPAGKGTFERALPFFERAWKV